MKFDTARLAPLDTPTFTGGPSAPTPTPGDNDTSLATTAFVKAAIDAALASIGANPWQPGDIRTSFNPNPPAGWILLGNPDAGTVGDASSGATIRANADTLQLFSVLFQVCNDTQCPLQNSAGTVITRASQGNNSTTAFNNHCRMSTPKAGSRVMGAYGAGAGLSVRQPGDTAGVETVTLDISTIPSHNHVVQSNYILAETYFATTSSYGINQFNGNTQVTGGNGPHGIVQPSLFVYWWMHL